MQGSKGRHPPANLSVHSSLLRALCSPAAIGCKEGGGKNKALIQKALQADTLVFVYKKTQVSKR
ncbi:hypothetical protein BS78_03G400600 [Paspalum vaginatum]|nr:hypothetical protein BS78_03G400600 [Paspalum vaginatum]